MQFSLSELWGLAFDPSQPIISAQFSLFHPLSIANIEKTYVFSEAVLTPTAYHP